MLCTRHLVDRGDGTVDGRVAQDADDPVGFAAALTSSAQALAHRADPGDELDAETLTESGTDVVGDRLQSCHALARRRREQRVQIVWPIHVHTTRRRNDSQATVTASMTRVRLTESSTSSSSTATRWNATTMHGEARSIPSAARRSRSHRVRLPARRAAALPARRGSNRRMLAAAAGASPQAGSLRGGRPQRVGRADRRPRRPRSTRAPPHRP